MEKKYYSKVDTAMNFVEREKEVIDFWKKNDVFEESVQKNEGGEEFSFYDGPPTANGKPHIGHILTRVMKDIIPRYQTMKGKHVLRKAGWDTHGLPVELEVEKSLGMDGKQDIEKYGIEPFIKKCKESVWKYKGEWEKMSERVGYWADMDNPYVTYDDKYIESVWWALKEIWKKGLLYKGHKIVPYCPRCGTALSSHEVAQGYKDVKETSVFVRFRRKGEENSYFLAWTTTPWTLPSNVALCVNPDEDYAEIEAEDGARYVLAQALVPSLFEKYTLVSVKKGKEYEFAEYEPLFDYAKGSFREKAYYVVCDGYVTLTDGSGIVHTAPAFGEDDYRVGQKYGLPVVNLVDERGCFKPAVTDFAGIFVKKADKGVIALLKEKGLLFKEMLYEHSYPHCWRCDTPLLYYARESWFIKVTAVKDELIKANNSVNWMPETIKTGRMGNFLENVIDWGLSRDRYWGTPLPVWVCPDCGKVHVIGSKQELKDLCGIEGDIELHRPYIDECTFKCECGGTMKRTPEVIDCWFDSGSMPFAQYHYPFENKDLFDETFPADFISEAVDQTRGWFYTLLVISTILFGKSPFKNCIVLGHVNDKNGVKMSKHKGNVVDPWSVLDKQGADAVRWYFYTSSAPWLPSRFYPEAVSEAQRKYMGTLWNTYAFFVLYADIDKYDPSKYRLSDCKLTLMDKWILSKLNTLIQKVDRGLANYEITDSARSLQEFVDVLSNWYVRRGRERYWGSGMTEDKAAAYTTLYTVLVTVAKLTAPFTPFIAEQIYGNLVPGFYADAPKSVHMCSFPVADLSAIDPDLEKGMDSVLDVVVLGRAARSAGNVKNRQPLSEMVVVSDRDLDLNEELKGIILDELNIKQYREAKDAAAFVSYKIKPQLKTLGPKYGKLLGAIRSFLDTCNGAEVVNAVKDGGVYKTVLAGEEVAFAEEDLLISTESAQGFVSASDKGITVALNTALTPELIDEGIEREIVSRLQTMRKEAGFEVTDRIRVCYSAGEQIARVLKERAASVSKIVLADELSCGSADGYTKEWELAGEKVTLTVKKV
ncbi:MAG TPA: isoleucine--tRNA ligase [Candidatus Borkfalkia excrementavium]|uniref:Isoleucine--tRNA ligase n=1 Tax=Candidatus Borkfalkia excrementavium TaxID=2838505 RepID=A0A9D2CG40_9FIRM|nr:isoleucine--tRNA ligase [Candidatus Borkfalkia excrementavium]